jgi:hypothetical protein
LYPRLVSLPLSLSRALSLSFSPFDSFSLPGQTHKQTETDISNLRRAHHTSGIGALFKAEFVLARFYLDTLSYVTARDHLSQEGGNEGGERGREGERERWTEGERMRSCESGEGEREIWGAG